MPQPCAIDGGELDQCVSKELTSIALGSRVGGGGVYMGIGLRRNSCPSSSASSSSHVTVAIATATTTFSGLL